MRLYFLAASLLLTVTVARADVTVVTEASAPASSFYLPAKGLDKAAVTRRYGQPLVRHAPVGGDAPRHPPITRWDYDGYSVFFEYNHVVHTVQWDHPAPVKVQSGLVRAGH